MPGSISSDFGQFIGVRCRFPVVSDSFQVCMVDFQSFRTVSRCPGSISIDFGQFLGVRDQFPVISDSF